MAGHKYRNDNNSSYTAPNEVIPKWGEMSRYEIQFRLKNHLIWVRKTGVMATR